MTGNIANPACSVVIRAFNEEKHIGRLLTGLMEQTLSDIEIILVDSGSTDGTLKVMANFPVRLVLVYPDEFSFGRSLNRGIAQARSERIVIASAHVYPVYPDWLERLLAPLEDPQVALAYGKQRSPASAHFSEKQVFARWYPDHSVPRQAHPFCNNANAAIRRTLWQRRPYDEALTGLEDLDWARWAMGQGYTISYVAEAEVIHVHNESAGSVYNRYRREAMAFKHIFAHEQFRLTDLVRLVVGNIASDAWHAARQRVLRQNLAGILWFRWMQFWGTYQGYRHSGPLTRQLRQTFYYPPGMSAVPRLAPREVEPIQYNDLVEGP